jgi:hypothetical protein
MDGEESKKEAVESQIENAEGLETSSVIDPNSEQANTLSEFEKILKEGNSEESEDDKSNDESDSDNKADKKEEENSGTDEKSEPVIDDYLLSKAEEFGFTNAEIRQFKSSGELARALSVIERKMKSLTPASNQPEPKKQEKEKDEDLFDIDSLDPDDFSEEKMIQAVKSIKSHFDKRVRELEDENKNVKESAVRDTQKQIISEFDTLVSTQEGKLSELFGKGKIDSGLSREHESNRVKLFKTFTAIGNTITENVPVKEVLRRALAATFPDEFFSAKENEIKANITKRKELAILPPGGVKKSGTQAILDEFDSILKNKKE